MRKNIFPFRKYRRKKLFLQKREKKKRQARKKFQFCLRSPLPRIFRSSIDAITISYNI